MNQILTGLVAIHVLAGSVALLRLTWENIELELGIVALHRNKNDDPRSWALRPDAARALRWWYEERGRPKAEAPVFVDEEGRCIRATAAELRAEYLGFGIDRAELHGRGSRAREGRGVGDRPHGPQSRAR